ncbi:MAG: 50S ribosomal protein L29 [Candidatus Glassbacteria bacterium RIFCSPLOWO2_12_FULL_58_11]|uniref:Large ribosomal subunit protein uL29 n=2 Tax=Candidatus Glassiibacteriota TaxID=1817805 RepID=A0A1F5YP72_9BACT|nr:MAG: 50S ribosomal protein L29 [Candidatus Glassbacteria bacterium GWA2_58_10]OGG02000.1 MAG: 50S ribosomal protein L29 [Candidatus Glassbacteria bacterium RIFCSPLOWO2_12_FULL_58_11]
MKAHELREMTKADIEHRLGELKEEYFKLSFRNSVHKIDNPMQLRSLRRDIARCFTILKQK